MSLIRETKLNPVPIQTGYGVPSHISPAGSFYFDFNTGIEYQNKDGVNNWVQFFDGTNRATDVYVTGGTYSSGSATFTNNTGGTFSVTGFTTSASLLGSYLPLSGGTVTGNTIFTSGLTANTLNITNYIDFNTGTTNPTPLGGRVFFDNGTKALSYYDILGSNVPIAMGQQLYTRVYNATGSQIDKGKVISITGTSNGLPSATLAVNTHAINSAKPIGLAAENIANNSEGLVLNNGILSGITLNTFSNGDTLYLSDTVPGGYVSTTSSLAFTARTNEIGYVIQTGTTTGKIYVNINNEDSNLSLTDIERNILEGNVISTGTYAFTGLTRVSNTLFSIATMSGWVVKNTNGYATLPEVINVIYSGTTGITTPYLTTADATYVLITSAATVTLQSTFPTPQERRQNIYLGKVVHPNRSTILNVNNTVDFDVSPMSALRDMWTSFKLINVGIIPSANGANLNINTSAGTLWGNGIGWVTNQLNPNSVSLSGKSPASFAYRTQTGGTGTETTTIDTLNYDVGGVITNVPGAGNFTTQRIYQFPTGLVRIQYGQHYYPTLAKALAELPNETFVEYSNNRDNGILIGYLTVKDGTTDLSNTNDAIFTFVSKFGEALGGTAGLSTTTLQQAYDNSTTPEIIINAALDGLTIKNGTGNPDATTHLLEGQNTAGAVTSFITAAGGFSGSSVSAITITTPSFTANANGLTASTISATTYQNLPIDIRTSGATYSNNTFTFTNNTGGTFNVLFNTLTGLTVNGSLLVTGTTYLGNGTFTKAGNATGDILLDNSATDTPGILFYYANNSNYGIDSWNGSYDVLSGQLLRFTNKLNETGGAVKAAIDTSGNMAVGGFIKANAWRAGQVVNDIMLSNTEVTISTTTIATSTSDTDFLTYSYTPVSSTSYLVIHYHLADYRFDSGTGNDSYFSRIKVDGAEITYSRQSTVNGNRSGVLFPLTGRYTNSSTTAKSIVVACRRDSADDNITITNSSSSMWLRITEIAR